MKRHEYENKMKSLRERIQEAQGDASLLELLQELGALEQARWDSLDEEVQEACRLRERQEKAQRRAFWRSIRFTLLG